MNNKIDKTIDQLLNEQRDFNQVRTRRVVGALAEIKYHVNEILEKFQEELDNDHLDLVPEDVDGYDYARQMIKQMAYRLESD